MFKLKFFFTVLIFSSLLIVTSIIKNQTREIEKKIFSLNKIIANKEKDLNETQLDFAYLTSPAMVEQRVKHIDDTYYLPMKNSKIFLSLSNFIDLQNKLAGYKDKYVEKIQEK